MTRLKKLIFLSLLTALAIVVYAIEIQIPSLTSLPGIKMGLANMVSLATLVLFGPKEAFTVLLLRIFLGSFITGQVSALLFSLSGGVLSNVGMILLYLVSKKKINLWILSISGALLHTIGQLAIAMMIVKTPSLILYLPLLLLSSLISGYFIGLGTLFIVKHFKALLPSLH